METNYFLFTLIYLCITNFSVTEEMRHLKSNLKEGELG